MMRVNINVSDSINKWFENKANDLGVSKSALMCIALNDYIDQKEGLRAMGELKEIYDLETRKNGLNDVLNDK